MPESDPISVVLSAILRCSSVTLQPEDIAKIERAAASGLVQILINRGSVEYLHALAQLRARSLGVGCPEPFVYCEIQDGVSYVVITERVFVQFCTVERLQNKLRSQNLTLEGLRRQNRKPEGLRQQDLTS